MNRNNSFSEKFIRFFQFILPSPFSIAVLLTLLTYCFALFYTDSKEGEELPYFIQISTYWQKGFWELLSFSMQMLLMLVLGYVLAVSPIFSKFINAIIRYAKNTASAAFLVATLTIFMAYINWGLGLIFGAILARKIAEYFKEKNRPLNFPLITAAAYLGLMVWHGGLSGSAPLIIAEENHFLQSQIGIISLDKTVFSPMNLTVILLSFLLLPASFYFLGKRTFSSKVTLETEERTKNTASETKVIGAEHLDHSFVFMLILLAISVIAISTQFWKSENPFTILNPNFINFSLFFLALLAHGSIDQFVEAVTKSIHVSVGIILQFPLYAGIMGIMKYSGLIDVISEVFVSISDEQTFPIYTFISAGIVNIFVPSGGGQWAVQGPIIVETANQLHVPIEKCVMALAYGDQVTNMLQPFWALPLLGITGLKAKQILPYTLLAFVLGSVIFLFALLLF